ncbi:hypothetical protein DFH07DRAFT_998278, partial [Mycena maculata]
IVDLPDCVADLEYLLRGLYDPIFFTQKALPFRVLAGLVRLSRKYEFNNLWNEVVGRLTCDNPTTIEEFDALPVPKHVPTRIEPYPGVLFEIDTLASEHSILSVLPCASRLSLSQLFGGIPPLATLSPTNRRVCITARSKILKAQYQVGNSMSWCDRKRDILRSYVLAAGMFALTLEESVDWQLCPTCAKHTNEPVIAGRTKMWEELPFFFDLPPWTELRSDL